MSKITKLTCKVCHWHSPVNMMSQASNVAQCLLLQKKGFSSLFFFNEDLRMWFLHHFIMCQQEVYEVRYLLFHWLASRVLKAQIIFWCDSDLLLKASWWNSLAFLSLLYKPAAWMKSVKPLRVAEASVSIIQKTYQINIKNN